MQSLAVAGDKLYVGGDFHATADTTKMLGHFGIYDLSVTGVAELAPAAPLVLYPNPATTVQAVRLEGTAHASVQVLDLMGRHIATTRTDATGVAEISTAGLAPGVYIVRVGTSSKRLVVQ